MHQACSAGHAEIMQLVPPDKIPDSCFKKAIQCTKCFKIMERKYHNNIHSVGDGDAMAIFLPIITNISALVEELGFASPAGSVLTSPFK